MNNFLEEFKARGFFHQCTNLNALNQLMEESKPIVAYGGFDCTASSLHIGNLILIMILRLLQKHGHKPIVLVGGGTTKIGDPSGKDETRKILSEDDINSNKKNIKLQLSKFIKFENMQDNRFQKFNDAQETKLQEAILVDNADWLDDLNYSDFLRKYGKHFSINRMLSFDSVKLRLEREQNLSFLEFNYMLFQAYDFTILKDKYNCRLQVGGSDQWGNIVNGVELARRLEMDELYGLTTPLLTTSSGAKMGKSVSGAVWLDESLLPAYDYYQYWRNAEDADVMRFLKLFTDLDIIEICECFKEEVDINYFKKILAFEATKICHGYEKAAVAQDTAKAIFEDKTISKDLPIIYLDKQQLEQGIAGYELVYKANFAESKGEARRLIRGKGIKINDVIIEDENILIDYSYMKDDIIKLSVGKKRHVIIKIEEKN